MAIEIKDLSLVAELQDLQGEFLDSSTAADIRGGYDPNNPAAKIYADPGVKVSSYYPARPITYYHGAWFYV